MLMPSFAPPLLNQAWIHKPEPTFSQHQSLRSMEKQMKYALAALTATTPNFTAPSTLLPGSSKETGLHINNRNTSGGFNPMSHVSVRQDLGLTPAQSASGGDDVLEDEAEAEDAEEMEEEEMEGELQFEEDEEGNISPSLEDDEDNNAIAFEFAGQNEQDPDALMGDDDRPEEQQQDEQQEEEEEDDLAGVDPRDMDEEQQIRYLQRQHELEVRMQQLQRQQQQQQMNTSAVNNSAGSDFFAQPDESHITPPTRSARATIASGAPSTRAERTAARVAATASASTPAAGSSSISRTRGVAVPSTARRTLDLDSSNDSPMQLGVAEVTPVTTRSRRQVPASADVSMTQTPPNRAFANVSQHQDADAEAEQEEQQSDPAMNAEALATELGICVEEAEAILIEQLMVQQSNY